MTTALEEGPAAPLTAAADRLNYLKGRKIVVVDDAFDRPTRDTLDDEDVAEFLERAAGAEGGADDFERVTTVRLAEQADVDDDVIARLWAARGELTPLGDVVRTTIFADAIDKLSNVTPFCDHLRELGFDVVEVGQAGDIPPEGVALVLVDYVLGPEGRPSSDDAEAVRLRAQAIETSTAVIKRFYLSFPKDADKPFIVLMSTRRKVDVLVDAFQENSELLRGTFDFVTKAELCKRPTLEFKLRTWNYALPSRHEIQHFVEALTAAVDDVGARFRRALRQLSFQDYAYIQALALQDDGHPLGDYMLWLYSSFLGDLLLSRPQVLAQREKLDAMEFPAFLPTEEPPSAHLAELYQTTVGAPSDPIRSHPRDGVSETEAPQAPPPAYAQLGDVFVKDEHAPVYMVLNAACDLAFAPHTARACDPEQAILLIPGQLTPLYDGPPDMKFPRTELFELDKRLFRVIWRDDRVFSSPHKDLVAMMRRTGHERRYRLRMPYALLVQQSFASKLTRVGLPVAPPICVAVDVEAHCVDDAGNGRLLCAPIRGGAFVIHRRHKNAFVQEFVLTGKCVHALQDHLDDVAEQQSRVPLAPVPVILDKDGKPDEAKRRDAEEKQRAGEPARARKKAELIKGFKDKHDFWFSLVTDPKPLPALGESVPLADGFLSLCREGTLTGPWGRRPYVVLNVRYGVPATPGRARGELAAPIVAGGEPAGSPSEGASATDPVPAGGQPAGAAPLETAPSHHEEEAHG